VKVIFLDIDGVVNHVDTRVKTHNGWCFVDNELVARIKKIVDATGAEIVLSSTWRLGWIQGENDGSSLELQQDFNELRAKFREFGMEFYDRTPLMNGFDRGNEIGAWLKEHTDIESYIILDDFDDMGEYGIHLLLTSAATGITESDVNIAIDFLNGKVDINTFYRYGWEN